MPLACGNGLEERIEAKQRDFTQLLPDLARFLFVVVQESSIKLGQDFFTAAAGRANEKDAVKPLFIGTVSRGEGFLDAVAQGECRLFRATQCRFGRAALGALANTRVMGQGRGDFFLG